MNARAHWPWIAGGLLLIAVVAFLLLGVLQRDAPTVDDSAPASADPAGHPITRPSPDRIAPALRGSGRAAAPPLSEPVRTGGSATTSPGTESWGGSVLTGRVDDANGRPVAAARVKAVRQGDTPKEDGRPTKRVAESGADGGFRLTRLPPGEWQIQARVDGDGDRLAQTAQRSVVIPGEREVVLTLARARDIRGRLIDRSGKRPPGQLAVVMRGVRPDGANGTVWYGTVAADGTFVVPDVRSGANIFWAWTTDQKSQLALTILHDIQPGTGGLQVVLEPGQAIEGTVVDDRGELLAETGWLYAYDGDVLVNGVRLHGDGTFRTHLLPGPRPYDLTAVTASGWSATELGVTAGTSGLVLRTRRTPALTGSVFLPDGSAAGAGIQVEARAVGMHADKREGTAVQVQTDADGRFAISKLGNFPFVVTAKASDKYAPARVPGTVYPGSDVQLRLQEPQLLRGRAVRASSEPARRVVLWVLPEDGAFPGWSVKTDDKGHFTLRLNGGGVRLAVETLDGTKEVGRATVPADNVIVTVPDPD